ncbi:site-specific integrase [Paenibacillus sp. N3/727]|uniref:tyrosine-type recombinase/integrase n=1 Tax=Paenibacillus sp. N3/727 TaxID=2925845 RepID=UPI001F5301B9|nr:site-specific integrase [Paenibacillus sp. N3/727]UNK20456.1 site-specific integrase [Paenibacillus sp. N3/727]
MSNKIYEQGLFNEEQKNRFLKDLTQNTYAAYLRVLNRAKSLEEQLEKDLYDFNIYEIEKLIDYLNPNTLSSVTTSVSVIQNYIRWSIEQDLRGNNLNPLDAIVGDEFYRKFIDKSNKVIFSLSEIEDITGGLVNFQDSAIVQAIFEGVMGKRYSEILNLTIQDIDEENNELLLKNEVNEHEIVERKLKVSPELIKMLIKAAEETEYYKNNGNPSVKVKSPTANLSKSNYVFRNTLLNTKEIDRADYFLVFRRLKKIADWNEQPYLTGINIRNSGMLYMANLLYKNSQKLEKPEIDCICEAFNISKIKNSNDYHTTKFRKEFLNIDKIIEVYGAGE